MKRFSKILFLLLVILSVTSLSAQDFYKNQWKKIQENSKAGKFKSNLPIITETQKQAMKENNTIELIKTLKAEFLILNRTSDDENIDASSKFFAKLKQTESQLKGDDKIFFSTLIPSFVSDYFQENEWEIVERTNVASEDVATIETWSKLDFKNYFTQTFAKLDASKAKLKKMNFSKYKEVFSNSEDSSYFPAVYDWYVLEKIKFLRDSSLFTKDEMEVNKTKINILFDEEIASNSGNTKLYFSHEKLKEECRFSQCKDQLERLQNLAKSNEKGDYKVFIYEEIAEILWRNEKPKEALAVINQAKKEFPNSAYLNNVQNVENQILNETLNIIYDAETQTNKPIHFVAQFKNVNQFHLHIYKVDDVNDYISFAQNHSFSKIKKTLIRKEKYQLNDPKDYVQHSTSLEIKPLPSGIYLVKYFVDENSENLEKEIFQFFVSENKVIYYKKANQKDSTHVLKLVNSENGAALANENVVLYEFSGGKVLSENKIITDKDGLFSFPKTNSKEYYRNFLISQPNSKSFQKLSFYGEDYYERNTSSVENKKAQIFTDRAIYRPGQTVYFKVINTQYLEGKESVVAREKQKIKLKDANEQEVASQEFVTNEFGSYHGSFVLPKGKMNGVFILQTDGIASDYHYIQVEEYKRPKFEVTFEPIKEEYKYGQTLELKGKAMMFSGVALSNTKVSYEIKKYNIRWRYFSWFPRDYSNENSILGEVKTDEKGEFVIKVELKKDEEIEGIQIDNFAVNASVTDINGETQFADTNVKVASVSHYIKAEQVKDTFDDEKVTLKVETKNYNEQNLKKSYQVKLSKLKSNERIFRNTFKEVVQDFPQMSKSEFVTQFPHDRFDKNDIEENRKVETTILNGTVHNEELLDLGKLQPGNYTLELYNIEGKDTIKTQQNFAVYSKKAVAKNQNIFLEIVQLKNEVKRGESSEIFVYSSIPDALVNVFVQDGVNPVISSVQKMKNGVLKFPFTAPQDKQISNLNFSFQIVAFNDVQTEVANISVIDSEEPLKIETVTFRDKIQPNSKEKWTVKIVGNTSNSHSSSEKITAEVLANMYDMSLDQFRSNRFAWETLLQFNDNFQNYSVNEYLQRGYYQKNFKYLQRDYLKTPEFSWKYYLLFEGESDADLDGISDMNDACPNVPGSSRYRGCPQPKAVVAEEVTMSLKGRLAGVSVSDNAVEIVNSGRQLTEEEKKLYTDVIDPLDVQERLLKAVPIRQNLNETAFFYPNLLTDKDGNVSFEFTSPEALTKWKLMFLAHTKDARAATLEKEVVTQKEFSVTPNYPRFLREGDELNLQSKLSNLTSSSLNGSATLQILDAFTNEDISSKFGLNSALQNFTIKENGNTALTWKVKVPANVESIIMKVVAKAGNFSDGEQKAVAVLPNRMLITEAVPVFVKEGETKTFVLENLKNTDSKTLSNVSNTLELTTNPIWEIMFALPSLKNDQHNSADVVFNKWFADVLASEIFKANPKMKTVFEEYQSKGLLTSNLEKNQELKQTLLDETPWVLESKNETEQMTKLALLFDVNTMKNSINQDWSDLVKLQNPDGGFSWYSGYPSSYSSSLYVLKNLGKINLWLKENLADYQSSEQKEMVVKLINYVDNEIQKYYASTSLSNQSNSERNGNSVTEQNGKSVAERSRSNVWSNYVLEYLNARNYWEKEFPLKGKGLALKSAVKEKAKTAKITDFTFFGLHRAALLMNDYGLKDVSNKLMTYLKETSVDSKNQGVYWKQNLDDWGWFSSKVVNHTGALEAFNQLKSEDQKFIEDMKVWLITQKEVNSWGSSRGTAEVIFTILNSGKSWTNAESDKAEIIWGGKKLQPQTQATGYVKKTITSDNLDKNLASLTIKKDGPGIVQGGLFWQYYEDLDKIKSSENYLTVTKELYKKVKTVNGEELQKITLETPLKVGDKVTVRMILNTDRAMEFIQIKDMRAAGFEPLTTISGYQWNNSLGYYQSTKDASTNFYIETMPKGKYVFEYDLICNASGVFSNGITTIQNYYAPQMSSHTKGTLVEINE